MKVIVGGELYRIDDKELDRVMTFYLIPLLAISFIGYVGGADPFLACLVLGLKMAESL